MAHGFTARKNKQQKFTKLQSRYYLHNPGEPFDNASNDVPAELEAELLENSFFMRRRFRQTARELRDRDL